MTYRFKVVIKTSDKIYTEYINAEGKKNAMTWAEKYIEEKNIKGVNRIDIKEVPVQYVTNQRPRTDLRPQPPIKPKTMGD